MAGRRRVEGLLLAPGAGADSTHHTLAAVAEAVAPTPVRCMDFPYRLAGRRAPDRAPVLLEALRAQLDDFRSELGVGDTSRIVMGGRSMGGRIASMAAAGGTPCRGLVLLSYPLHPPGQADRLRVEHFCDISVPTLFVSGLRDPFGSPDEFAAHVGAIAGPVTQVWIAGGHDPGGRASGARGAEREVAVCAAVREWMASVR